MAPLQVTIPLSNLSLDFLDGTDVRYSNLIGGGMLSNTFNKTPASIRKESSTNSNGAGTQAVETRNDEGIEEEEDK